MATSGASEEWQRGASGVRVALVIGNGDYSFGPKLANPIYDASELGQALERLGFAPVVVLHNAGLKEQNKALADFGMTADEADMAVIYFAGHGMEVDGQNFLLPVDAQLDHVRHLRAETMRLSDVLESVSGAKQLRLVILDACRDNPFRGRMRGLEGTRSFGRGLGFIEPPRNTLVAYAARDGTQARDGKPGEHSPFAAALLKHIETPNVDVRILFGRVCDDVRQTTQEMQEPHIYGAMGGQHIYLTTADEGVAPADWDVHERTLREERDWERTQRHNTVEAFETFLRQYPSSVFAFEAAAHIDALHEDADFASAAAHPTSESFKGFLEKWPSGRRRLEAQKKVLRFEEEQEWPLLKRLLDMPAYNREFDAQPLQAFLEKYPDSSRRKTVVKKLEEAEKALAYEVHANAYKWACERYIAAFPEGARRAEAERLLSGGGDDRLWIKIQERPDPSLIERYLDEWPDGLHVAKARELLERQRRSQRWTERGSIALGSGIGLGGLALIGAALYAVATLVLVPTYEDYSGFKGTSVEWVRTRVAEWIKPKPQPIGLDLNPISQKPVELPGLPVTGFEAERSRLKILGRTTVAERAAYFANEQAPGETLGEYLLRINAGSRRMLFPKGPSAEVDEMSSSPSDLPMQKSPVPSPK